MESASAPTAAAAAAVAAVNKKLAAEVNSKRQPRQQEQHKRCGSLSRGATTHHVWLLSIMSLIFIAAMLAGDCQARAFLGTTGGGAIDPNGVGAASEGSNFNMMGTLTDSSSNNNKYNSRQVDSSALEYALEMSCRNLVESLFQPRTSRPGDFRGIVDYLDYADLDARLKRASPKHTPRFGR